MEIVSHYWGSLKIPLTLENHLIFDRRYILIHAGFSSHRHVSELAGGGVRIPTTRFWVGFGAFF